MVNKQYRDDLREAYDGNAQKRDSNLTQGWKIDVRHNFLSLLQQENKRSLLEIGAGHGRDSKFFQDEGLEVVCIDLSQEMVKLCRGKGITANVMDVADLQFPLDSFDAVYSLNSLLHIGRAELPSVLQSITEIIKPTGLFYLGTYGGHDFEGIKDNDTYTPKRFFSYYSDENIRRVVAGVFDVISFKRILLLPNNRDLHFQSLVLRNRKL